MKANTIKTAATMLGAANLNDIFQNIVKNPAPSTSAASSSSIGKSRNACLISTTTKGRLKVVLTMINANLVSRSLKNRIIRKIGIIVATGGNTL